MKKKIKKRKNELLLILCCCLAMIFGIFWQPSDIARAANDIIVFEYPPNDTTIVKKNDEVTI
nr:hypothetical protein [bacterium]